MLQFLKKLKLFRKLAPKEYVEVFRNFFSGIRTLHSQ